ncbi:hypothetical protein G7046_g9030 [Stylonectria norvegica]|nr:hypothetical protein G7046_g9030 [Stylonectria norvegica]
MALPPINLTQPLYSRNPLSQSLENLLLPVWVAGLNDAPPSGKSAELAADQFDRLYPGGESPELYLWSMWNLLAIVVSKVPADDPRQEWLVDVMRKLSVRYKETTEIWGREWKIWADFPILGPAWREVHDRSPLTYQPPPSAKKGHIRSPPPQPFNEWINYCSFTARLHAASIHDFTNLILWELRAALEEPLAADKSDAALAAACEWILHAGRALYDQVRTAKELSEHEQRSLRTGSLIDASPGLSLTRWVFWRDRLELLGRDAGEGLKGKMEEAVRVMKELETEDQGNGTR